ncbi:MAG: hypothetical protein ABSE53_08715 [Terracidiphilus sp.]|jgi:uncharacterized membrane protein
MKTWHVFLAIAAVLSGATILISLLANVSFQDTDVAVAIFGIIFISAGATYFWKQSGFRGLKPK